MRTMSSKNLNDYTLKPLQIYKIYYIYAKRKKILIRFKTIL